MCYVIYCKSSSIRCNFDSTASSILFFKFLSNMHRYYITCSTFDYLWLNKNWGFLTFFGSLSFSYSILITNLLNPFFHFSKKHAEKNGQRYERSRIVVVIVVLNSTFFCFKTTMFFPDFPSFIFKVNHVLIEEEGNPFKKCCYSWGTTWWLQRDSNPQPFSL